MFVIKTNAGLEKTVDIEQAIRWHSQGRFVFVAGWVKAEKQNKVKNLSAETFEDVIKFYPKWKITTEPSIPETPSWRWYAGRRILAANKQEVKEKAQQLLSSKKNKVKQKKQTRGLYCGKRRQPKIQVVAASPYLFEEKRKELIAHGKPTNTIRLYHGTKIRNIEPILLEGFKLKSYGGMLGRGVYAGKIDKAQNYSEGLLLVVECLLGLCKEIDSVERLDDPRNVKYDSLHIGSGRRQGVYKGFLRHEEWVFRDPRQLKVVGVVERGW